MSDRAKKNLETAGWIIAIATGAWGMIGGLVVLPNRMQAMEQRQTNIEQSQSEAEVRRKADRELLIRIEERIIVLQKQVERNQ
jgi:hypothetical protein